MAADQQLGLRGLTRNSMLLEAQLGIVQLPIEDVREVVDLHISVVVAGDAVCLFQPSGDKSVHNTTPILLQFWQCEEDINCL